MKKLYSMLNILFVAKIISAKEYSIYKKISYLVVLNDEISKRKIYLKYFFHFELK